MEPSFDSTPCKQTMPERIHIVSDVPTRIEYEDSCFEVSFADNAVIIRDRGDGQVTIRQKNQQVPYKATILGGLVLTEERTGEVAYEPRFFIDWEEDFSVPELCFKQPPRRITRAYRQGQRIELGLERVSSYCVQYQDGVSAKFVRRPERRGFEFSFSTGFYGTFWYDDDGSYTLKFKGDRLRPEEDDLRSQSKFIVSRSKYTGMLLLILQADAVVQLG